MSAKLNRELSEAIRDSRRQILNITELIFFNDSRWPSLRSQILKIFGSQGLERFLCEEDDLADEDGNH